MLLKNEVYITFMHFQTQDIFKKRTCHHLPYVQACEYAHPRLTFLGSAL